VKFKEWRGSADFSPSHVGGCRMKKHAHKDAPPLSNSTAPHPSTTQKK
jgi:hypothetical protein